ncbi:MAG: hypothetical protein JST50_06995 [Bacteroidetes bacterium]|nr:hypothetical protein [Bacteroidota bacterium]
MKASKIFLVLFILSVCTYCIAQGTRNDKQVTMLKEFYASYCKLWAAKPLPPPKEFYKKLDSLQKVYCSQKIRKEAKDWFDDDGHDLYTNDWGIKPSDVKLMTVVKDVKKPNGYILNYTTLFHEAPSKYVRRNITLYLELIKTGSEYKIDSVVDKSGAK